MNSLTRLGFTAAALVAVLISAMPIRAEVLFDLPATALTTQPATVHLVGSFNDWSTTATPMMVEGGVWRARLSLPDGRH